MRYEAYCGEGYIEPNAAGDFTDPDDERPNAWLIGIFIDGALASSIRLHIASRPEHFLPATRFSPISSFRGWKRATSSSTPRA